MDDKNNLLEKLGIFSVKEDNTPKKKVPYNPRPTSKTSAARTPAHTNKYSSDNLAMEYEEMLRERAIMAKQIADLEAKAKAQPPVTPAATPAPKATAAPSPAPAPVKTKATAPVQTVTPTPLYQTPAPIPTTTANDTTNNTYTYHDTEEFSSVNDIYTTNGKDISGANCVYVVESFANTLPEDLSADTKRDVVLRILNVSNIDANKLVKDGQDRLNILTSFSNDFKEYTKDYVSSRTTEVAILEDQIRTLKKEILERNKLQAKQQAEIAKETAKISTNMVYITDTTDNA